MAKTQRRTAYRDSKTGEFLTKKQFERKKPSTVEKERIRIGKRKK
jgi:hypothetical protein